MNSRHRGSDKIRGQHEKQRAPNKSQSPVSHGAASSPDSAKYADCNSCRSDSADASRSASRCTEDSQECLDHPEFMGLDPWPTGSDSFWTEFVGLSIPEVGIKLKGELLKMADNSHSQFLPSPFIHFLSVNAFGRLPSTGPGDSRHPDLLPIPLEPMGGEEEAYIKGVAIPNVSDKARLIAAGVEAWLYLSIQTLNFLWLGRNAVRIKGPMSKLQLEAVKNLRADVLSFCMIPDKIPAFDFESFFNSKATRYLTQGRKSRLPKNSLGREWSRPYLPRRSVERLKPLT